MREITFADRVRYRFDNILSRGAIAMIGLLFLASAVMIVVMSLVVLLAGAAPAEDGQTLNFGQMVWFSLLRTLDSGTMGGDTGSPIFVGSMLVVTFGGIFVVSALIGVINNGLEDRLEQMRKGRSFVVEQGHTLILGWSPQVFSIISELVIANANLPRSCIVILADKDKVEMEEEIRDRVRQPGRTRIVCRTGDPIDPNDLEIANPDGARSIIILSPEAHDPDSHVIKTLLALTNNPQRRPQPYHIVCEIRERQNLEVARLVGKDEAQLVLFDDLVSRVMVQTCRQSGLSVIYTELLDFGGDEIYFHEEPGVVGKTFGEALLMYEDSALIGLRYKDGLVRLHPPLDRRIEAGDQVIAISEDDDTVRLSGLSDYQIDESAIREKSSRPPRPERTLILGWNARAPAIINQLDGYVAPGSEVMVVADVEHGRAEIERECAGIRNQSVTFQQGDTTDRRLLDDLNVASYDHIITLSYSDTMEPQNADAHTLITLLHLRDIAERGGHDLSIVSEMLDGRNRDLAEVTRADDFIVSDRLVSLTLSQVSENKDLMPVFADLFDPEGSELYLKPAGDYVELDKPLNFYTVVESARRRGEIAVGYRLAAEADDAARSYGVRVNPDKSQKVTFSQADRIIVLAEE